MKPLKLALVAAMPMVCVDMESKTTVTQWKKAAMESEIKKERLSVLKLLEKAEKILVLDGCEFSYESAPRADCDCNSCELVREVRAAVKQLQEAMK